MPLILQAPERPDTRSRRSELSGSELPLPPSVEVSIALINLRLLPCAVLCQEKPTGALIAGMRADWCLELFSPVMERERRLSMVRSCATPSLDPRCELAALETRSDWAWIVSPLFLEGGGGGAGPVFMRTRAQPQGPVSIWCAVASPVMTGDERRDPRSRRALVRQAEADRCASCTEAIRISPYHSLRRVTSTDDGQGLKQKTGGGLQSACLGRRRSDCSLLSL